VRMIITGSQPVLVQLYSCTTGGDRPTGSSDQII
jgi:hypothetical protein